MTRLRPLTEVLAEGELDLIDILVSSKINCKTCYKFKENDPEKYPGFGGFCEDMFTNWPEISLCLHWRQRKGTLK